MSVKSTRVFLTLCTNRSVGQSFYLETNKQRKTNKTKKTIDEGFQSAQTKL